MARKKIPTAIQNRVLIESRRRCCICFGLDRDSSIKRGQVGHLDRHPNNNAFDNLAFLCLKHHDIYDSRSRQSKGLTASEVRQYRKELYEAIDSLWKQPVRFGKDSFRPVHRFEGHYIRETNYEVAEIDVRLANPGRVKVQGLSLWGINREYGPHIGQLDFEAQLSAKGFHFEEFLPGGKGAYRAKFTFNRRGLFIEEKYVIGYFGMNVSFAGQYEKAR